MSRPLTRRLCRRTHLLLLLAAGALWAVTQTAGAQEPPRWTLDEALATAFAESPALHARRAGLREVEGDLMAAGTLLYNPELELQVANRSSPGASTTDRGLSLSQELEVAGQRRRRVAVAREELAAAEADLVRAGRRLAFEVESAFAEAVRTRELLKIAEIDARLARQILDFSQRRLDGGATTQIEVNLARASTGRAERAWHEALADDVAARYRLAEIAGLDPAVAPEPVGELVPQPAEIPPLDELLAAARERRADLRAAQRERQAAAADLELARAERRPNLIVGGFVEREEGTDDIAGATVGIALPLFNRGQGRIARAQAAAERLRFEQQALLRAIELEVATAHARLHAASHAAEHLRDQVFGTLEKNVDLLQRAFEAGRIGAAEVVTLQREFVASGREYIDALAGAWQARIALDLATGRSTPPPSAAGEDGP